MNFGLGDYIQKVEEYLGEAAAYLLVILFYIGAVACMVLLFLELYGALSSTLPESGLIGRLVPLTIYVGVICIANWAGLRYIRRRGEQLAKDQKKDMDSARKMLEKQAKKFDLYTQKRLDECAAMHEICRNWMETVERVKDCELHLSQLQSGSEQGKAGHSDE